MQGSQTQSKLEELFQRKSTAGIILAMALPTVASQLISVIYSYADSMYVGSLNSPEQFAAIALATPVILVLTAIANFWGVGGGSMMARALGRKDNPTANKASAFSGYAALVTSAICSLVAYLAGDRFLRFLGASDTVLPYARQYLFWMFIVGGVPTAVSMTLAHLLRSEGRARHASTGLMLGCILNVILDPFFIFDFGFGMGVEGAALATMLSNCVALLYLLAVVWRHRAVTCLSFRLQDVLVRWSLAREVMTVGLPSAVIMLCSAISNNVMNILVSAHGDQAIAALGIAKKLDFLPVHTAIGITQGALPLMAYSYTSGNHEKMRDILYTTLKMAFGVLLVIVMFLEIFAHPMSQMFIRDPETVRYATSFIRVLCLSIPFYALNTTIDAFFQAINYPKTAFGLSILRKGPLDIPLMFLLEACFFFTNIIWAQPIMDVVTMVISMAVVWFFFRKRELTRK